MASSDGLNEIEKGLFQWAVVTNVISPTQFQATRFQDGRSAYADGFFTGWTVYVLRDIRSAPTVVAAPQGEQVVATAFVQRGGIVTHPAFTTPMVAGDEILMVHPNIGAGVGAAIVGVLLALAALQADVGDASASALGSLYGILGNPAVDLATSIAAILAALGVPVPPDVVDNVAMRDVVGNKADTANATVGATSSLMRYTKAVLNQVNKMLGAAPVVGQVVGAPAQWQGGVGTSGEAGSDLVTIGAAGVRNKLHSLLVNISALTPTATITVKMFMQVNGVERRVYRQNFVQGVDPNGLWIVNGTLGIHEALRVEVQSNNALDNGLALDYDYLVENM